VAGGGFPSLQLRKTDTVHTLGRIQLHHVHAGHIAGLDHPARAFGAVKACQQQPAWLVGHIVAQQVFFFVARVVKVTDQYFKAPGA